MRAPWKRSDRPLHRRAVKIASLAFGPRWSHAHNWLPFLRLGKEAGKYRSIIYKGRAVGCLGSADTLRKRLRGDRIYIIGSGPSVTQTNLMSIGPNSSVLLNGAVDLIVSRIASPLAVVVEDERFIWRHFDKLRTRVPPTVICIFSVSVIRAICEIAPDWFGAREILLIDDIRKPYMAPKPNIDELRRRHYTVMTQEGDAGISLQPDRGVFQGGSVVVSALQYAIHCRPASIGFIGIDISNASEPRFYEQSGNSALSRIMRAEKRIISHLVLGRDVCAANNIDVRNHSPVSALKNYNFIYDNQFEQSKGL